jgi:hypothetical protein
VPGPSFEQLLILFTQGQFVTTLTSSGEDFFNIAIVHMVFPTVAPPDSRSDHDM